MTHVTSRSTPAHGDRVLNASPLRYSDDEMLRPSWRGTLHCLMITASLLGVRRTRELIGCPDVDQVQEQVAPTRVQFDWLHAAPLTDHLRRAARLAGARVSWSAIGHAARARVQCKVVARALRVGARSHLCQPSNPPWPWLWPWPWPWP